MPGADSSGHDNQLTFTSSPAPSKWPLAGPREQGRAVTHVLAHFILRTPAPTAIAPACHSLFHQMPAKSNLIEPMSTTPEHASNRGAESTQPVLPVSPLAPIFYPRTVAVIGATEKPASVGRTILRNLMEQPSGATIFPVNPTRS